MILPRTLQIHRAPVLTLWATVVAERLGFTHDEAVTLGKAVAGLTVRFKERRWGIDAPFEVPPAAQTDRKVGEEFLVDLLGRAVPVQETPGGLRAVVKGQPLSAASVDRYLANTFGAHLLVVRQAMMGLAATFPPAQLAEQACALYQEFRPDLPAGGEGWGLAGTLDLAVVEGLGSRCPSPVAQ